MGSSEKTKGRIRNQKGLALITTLVMMVLALGVVAILLQLTTRSTRLTGVQQDYTTAIGAANAGAAVFINTVLNGSGGVYTPPSFTNPLTTAEQKCLNCKLVTDTSPWASPNWSSACTSCTSGGTSPPLYQTSDATTAYDIAWTPTTTTASGQTTNSQYVVYIKVIDTYLQSALNSGYSGNDASSSSACYGNNCTFYTVVSTAVGPAGVKATTQFIYRMPQ